MHTTLATFALMLLHGIASAGLLPEPERAQLTQRVLQAFWGKAVNSAGGVIQPLDERDRNTVPITDSQVQHAIDVGEVSGLAEWCGLDWKPHFFALTRSFRARGSPDKQVAFVGVLHGATQGRIVAIMGSRPCGASDRAGVERRMQESLGRMR